MAAAKKAGQGSLFEATHTEQRKRTGKKTTRKRSTSSSRSSSGSSRKRTTTKKTTAKKKPKTVAEKMKARHPKDTPAQREKRLAARRAGKVYVEGYTRPAVKAPRSKATGKITKGKRTRTRRK